MTKRAGTTHELLRAIYVVSPDAGEYLVSEAMVELPSGEVVMFMLLRDQTIEVEPDRPTIELLLDHRACGIVNTCAPVMVRSVEEAEAQVGKPYAGPTGWGE